MRKRILCYGDSNTYGYTPNGGRFGEDVRWPTRLQTLLGDGYTVIEEGFNGRTTVWDDPVEGGYKSGLEYLPPCLMSHTPLDLVLVMLGGNDAKKRFGLNAFTIAQCLERLVKIVPLYAATESGRPPRTLVVTPPRIGDWIMETWLGPIFGPEASGISRDFDREFRRVAEANGAEYLNAGDFVAPCREDALHLTAEGHARLAEAIGAKIKEIL